MQVYYNNSLSISDDIESRLFSENLLVGQHYPRLMSKVGEAYTLHKDSY